MVIAQFIYVYYINQNNFFQKKTFMVWNKNMLKITFGLSKKYLFMKELLQLKYFMVFLPEFFDRALSPFKYFFLSLQSQISFKT